MTAPTPPPVSIPAAFVKALDILFAGKALATGGETAALLEISTAHLARLGDDGRIFYRLKGKAWRYYAREDIEAFLQNMLHHPISQTRADKSRRPTINSTSLSRSTEKIVGFSAAQKRRERRELERLSGKRKENR